MLVLDQISKILISSFIEVGHTLTVIKNFFSLTNVTNTGAAFSILEGRTVFLAGVSILVFIALLKMSGDFEKNRRNTWAFGLLLGGIFGNFGDRLFLSGVRDFLKFKIFGYSFPVFNIADICIVLGVFLLIISIIKEDENGSNSKHGRKSKIR